MHHDHLPTSLLDQTQAEIPRAGLQLRTDSILSSARPCYRISRGSASSIGLGVSHFGGLPHLPSGVQWPLDDGKWMTFVAQINLVDLHEGSLGLPESGWLVFFMGGAEVTGSRNAVIYLLHECELMELSPPATCAPSNANCPISHPKSAMTSGVFPAVPISLKLAPSLPPDDDVGASDAAAVIDAFIDLHDKIGSGRSRLGGYPYCDGTDIDDAYFQSHCDWTLLLQVDSFDPVDQICWWDNGKLDFLIRRSDLERRDFTKTIACIAGAG